MGNFDLSSFKLLDFLFYYLSMTLISFAWQLAGTFLNYYAKSSHDEFDLLISDEERYKILGLEEWEIYLINTDRIDIRQMLNRSFLWWILPILQICILSKIWF